MNNGSTTFSRTITRENILFGVTTCVLVVIAHAIAYLTHEYSHSFMAWALGWMPSPLDLDYGKPTLYNVLFLGDVSDNVQYDPIFSGGHGVIASIIALSGPFIGNGLLYFLLYQISKIKAVTTSRMTLSFVYWLALMCAGNVWGYVPIRAITTHADIAIAAKGLHMSVWALFPFLVVPSIYIVYHFFFKMFPQYFERNIRGSFSRSAIVIAMTSYWFFVFFGGEGVEGDYGLVSQLLAIGSKYFLFPISVMYLSSKYKVHPRADAASAG